MRRVSTAEIVLLLALGLYLAAVATAVGFLLSQGATGSFLIQVVGVGSGTLLAVLAAVWIARSYQVQDAAKMEAKERRRLDGVLAVVDAELVAMADVLIRGWPDIKNLTPSEAAEMPLWGFEPHRLSGVAQHRQDLPAIDRELARRVAVFIIDVETLRDAAKAMAAAPRGSEERAQSFEQYKAMLPNVLLLLADVLSELERVSGRSIALEFDGERRSLSSTLSDLVDDELEGESTIFAEPPPSEVRKTAA